MKTFKPTWGLWCCCFSLLMVLPACANNGPADSCPQGVITEETDAAVAVGTSGKRELAQSFQVNQAFNLKAVQLKLLRKGAPQGSLILRLQADAPGATSAGADLPSGTDLSVSNPLAVTTNETTKTISDLSTFYSFALWPIGADQTKPNAGVDLTINKRYWLRLTPSYTTSSDDNIVQWAGNNSEIYNLGRALYETIGSNSWSATEIGATKDLLFKICTK